MYNRLDRIPEYRRVTDGRTDGRTSCDGIVRAMHTRRALKTVRIWLYKLINDIFQSLRDAP